MTLAPATADLVDRPGRVRVRVLLPHLLALAVLIVLPISLPRYLQSLALQTVVYAIAAVSLDLILGYGGMISLGHACFFGIGGYTAAALMEHGDIQSAWIGIPLAILAAAAGAAIAGVVALRVTGIYFMLVTFALAQLAVSVAQEWSFLTTGGAEGMAGIRYPTLEPFDFAWTRASFYYLALGFLVLTYCFLQWYVRSRFGVVLSATRQNELRARALGYNTWFYKYAAFVTSGAVAGLAGALFVYQAGIIVPANLSVLISGTLVFMVLVGGSRTLYGPILGAILLSVIQYYGALLLPATWPIILGAVFIAIVMYAENGLVGTARKLTASLRSRPGRA